MSELSGAPIRVAFVDDDARLLDGLRRMLRRKRREWAMEFASDPREFVERLESEPFDVVVSDMRMPELNGVGVLRAVLRCCPQATRLVLTGQAHARSWLELIGPGQRVLAKPCEAEQLEEAIAQAHLLTHQFERKEGEGAELPAVPPLLVSLREGMEEELAESQLEGRVLGASTALEAVAEAIAADTAQLPELLGAVGVPVILGVHALLHGSPGAREILPRVMRVTARAVAIAQMEHAPPELLQQTALAGVLRALPAAPVGSSESGGAASAPWRHWAFSNWGLPDAVCEAACHCEHPRESLMRGLSALPYVHAGWALEAGEGGELDRGYLESAEGCSRVPGWSEVELPWGRSAD